MRRRKRESPEFLRRRTEAPSVALTVCCEVPVFPQSIGPAAAMLWARLVRGAGQCPLGSGMGRAPGVFRVRCSAGKASGWLRLPPASAGFKPQYRQERSVCSELVPEAVAAQRKRRQRANTIFFILIPLYFRSGTTGSIYRFAVGAKKNVHNARPLGALRRGTERED